MGGCLIYNELLVWNWVQDDGLGYGAKQQLGTSKDVKLLDLKRR